MCFTGQLPRRLPVGFQLFNGPSSYGVLDWETNFVIIGHPSFRESLLSVGGFLSVPASSVYYRAVKGDFEKFFIKFRLSLRYVALLVRNTQRISILTGFLLLPPRLQASLPRYHFARRRAPDRPSGRRLKTPTFCTIRRPGLYYFASLFCSRLLESD